MATQVDISSEIPTPGLDSVKIANFIGGKWYEPLSQRYIDNVNPSTGAVFTQIPDSNKQDVDLAASAANAAFPIWSSFTPATRAKYIHKLAELIEANLENMAQFETMDQGKTLQMSRSIDIARSAANFTHFANYVAGNSNESCGTTVYPKAYTAADGSQLFGEALNYVKRTPIGVAGLISPWNLPLYLLTWKIAPSGNTCVCKPSEFTSVTAMMLTKLIKQSGIPDGVVNMVFGLGAEAGSSIVSHPDIPIISFTGGTITGKRIASAAAPMFKNLSLELGGKNPAIIFADTNMDECIKTTVRSAFLNQGEICLCTSRIYVEKSIYSEFVTKYKEQIRKQVIVGDPTNPKSFYGPLVSKPHFEKVRSYVQFAVDEGLDVEFCVDRSVSTEILDIAKDGALTIKGFENGFFMAPTVITGCKQDSKIVQEEIFGPVVTIIPFENEKEAITLANDIQYGLASTVWSTDQSKLRRVAGQIVSGMVWCNCWMVRDLSMPFGGFKASGVGTEGGQYSINFFTKKQTITLG
ncbi:hypothetical protein BB559_000084 [Furculomyces boomerangus]|uniref:Aldehyde dehydrogenase domain-containing protein n=2 Tax=Harpellales TaxID=61421 RepID=A0A2T9Z6H7_9FUNG|nr:hypothetical protein BB559_000084 [Furculomyces boomerangus]PWA00635.1 hypothetical protein BB558_003312 [Smittium angustum]